MSWMKRPQGGAAAPKPEHPGYAPPASQPYGNQQSMFPNYQGAPPTQPQQQQMWQIPQQPQQIPQQYNQQYGQVYQQQQFPNNTNQYFQQPQQYNQNYTNQNYDNAQQGFQQNYYQSQPQVQNFTQSEGNTDGWEENWNWGWEDSSKQQQKPVVSNQVHTQPQHYNNANVLEESFVSTNTWNWSMEDKKESVVQPSNISQPIEKHQNQVTHVDNSNNDLNIPSKSSKPTSASNVSVQEYSEEVKNLSDKEVIKEHIPNLALGKRFHLENLTPQWSIESQMSQDSSDGPQTLSEGTYRSENQSRNSSKGSPGPNTDKSNFNYSHSGFNETSLTNSEWSKQTIDDSSAASMQNNNRRESYEELANSVQDMTIASNENSVQDVNHSSHSVERVIENKKQFMGPMSSTSSPILDTNNFIPQQSSLPPPPPVSSVQIPPAPVVNPAPNNPPPQSLINTPAPASLMSHQNLPPLSSSLPIPPPTNFPTTGGQNPFKSSNPFAHKNVTKVASSNPQSLPPQVPVAGLASPTVVNKVVQQERHTTSYGANLETTPDNSERPDQPQVLNYRQLSINSQIPDNLEVAPQNDRNEYLQTAHLSTVDYGENTDFSGNIAPPGLRRMGVGQQELEYNQNLNISGDEPPPGLARMVPGQQTETDNTYSQRDDDYMDRQIDGQPTDISGRPYRQADGQQTSDNFTQPAVNRSTERRPVGLDRMVPGEPSNDEFSQYQSTTYNGPNDQRVVTGVDHEYTLSAEVGPTDIREQNVDGSDYTETAVRNAQRSIIGLEVSNTSTPDFSVPVDDQQREITMEGENLQDLSLVSSIEISFPREPTYDGINVGIMETSKDRSHEVDDVVEYAANNSRRQSLNRGTSGEDSERDRTFRVSPRIDRDKQKSSRDRDRERDKDRGRYSRSDRKYDRDPERRSGRDDRRGDKERRDRDRDRRNRDESPEPRRQRRSMRSHRYETEDTDYYSDKDRERRQYREGSYTSSKPPRGEERSRRRPGTVDRERRYEDERSRRGHTRDGRDARDGRDTRDGRDGRDTRDGRDARDERDTRDTARFERHYRAIDLRKCDLRRRERDRDDDDRKKETYSSGSRPGSREATDEEPTRRRDDRRRQRHQYEEYPSAEGAGGAGREAQRRQYEYYEHLRRTDPAAYMRIYKRLTDPRYAHAYYDGYGYGYARDERGSVHSGRSSEAGLKHADTYDRRARDANSLRTDFSDRELTTDMSLNLQLEESTMRSERMTPFKYSTQHVKCCVGARLVAVARGRDARVQLLPLAALARGPLRDQLDGYPGPLVAGVTHKKSVVEYCERRARDASAGEGEGPGASDVIGATLLWEMLALLLRQNGVVVGSDIAELLMKNTKQFEYKVPSSKNTDCASSLCEDDFEGVAPRNVEEPSLPVERNDPVVDEREALDKFREYLIYGNRQEALEWAMRCGLWAHALQLALAGERRARAAVAARFQDAQPPADPLRTLYAALAGRAPPALACISDERWGDWRPHAAILMSNASARPDRDRGNITQLGDTLNARGLIYSAQFCYLSAGVPFAAHPLAPLTAAPAPPAAPPRLSLLLADPRATTLQHFATNRAIFATEIYEYALSLSQQYVLHELVVYKLVLATRLTDDGASERALRYAEQAARALTGAGDAAPGTRALARAVAALADRLKYFDPALHDEPEGAGEAAMETEGAEPGSAGGGSEEPSPRHQQWLRDVTALAGRFTAEVSQTSSPQPAPLDHNTQYSWADQTLQQQQPVQVPQQYPDPVEEAPDYATQYYQQQQYPEPEPQPYEQYGATYDEPAQPYVEPYWQGDSHYGYNDPAQPPGLRRRGPGARPSPPVAGDALRPHRGSSHSNFQALDDAPCPPSLVSQRLRRCAAAAGVRPRYGSLLGRTVENWALAAAQARAGRPLVFGGTYPIDEPESEGDDAPRDACTREPEDRRRLRETVERSVRRFEAMLAGRVGPGRGAGSVRTFEIDEPLGALEGAPPLRGPDERVYLAGPKTYDIDEPVSLI